MLRAAAAGMNAFASDGSFLDQFHSKEQGDAGENLARGGGDGQDNIPSGNEEAATGESLFFSGSALFARIILR